MRSLLGRLTRQAEEDDRQPSPGRPPGENRARNLLGNRNWIPIWVWVAAATMVLLTLFSIRQTQRMKSELSAMRTQVGLQRWENQTLHADRQLYQRALSILSAPRTREVVLKPTRRGLPEIHAYWNAELGLLVAGRAIPFPGPDRTFQVWVANKQGYAISAGVFRPTEAGVVLHVFTAQREMDEATALAITEEPTGGRPQATREPLWIAPVR